MKLFKQIVSFVKWALRARVCLSEKYEPGWYCRACNSNFYRRIPPKVCSNCGCSTAWNPVAAKDVNMYRNIPGKCFPKLIGYVACKSTEIIPREEQKKNIAKIQNEIDQAVRQEWIRFINVG